MGNLLRKRREQENVVEDIRISRKGMSIYKPGTSIIPFSVSSLDEFIRDDLGSIVTTSSCTRPSVFNSNESENESSSKEVEESEPLIITAGQMENIYEQYKSMNNEGPAESLFMTFDTLKVVKQFFNMWQTDMIYKFDNYQAYARLDLNLTKKYSENVDSTVESDTEKLFLRHSIKMIITYKMILDRLETGRIEELLLQLAISHGLLGIAGADFKAMDLHLTKYLLQRNLINDESIISLVAFLSIISDKLKSILNERINKARSSYISQMGLVGRPNVTRDNYRCMKRWSQVVSIVNTKTDIIQKQIHLHKPESKLEDDAVTVDTDTLRRKDFIMRKLKVLSLYKNK